MLCTSEGYPVLDSKGTPIIFSSDYKAANLIFSDDGRIFYDNKTKGTTDDLGIKIGVYQFTNRAGLENASGTFYKVTDASGAAVEESTNTNLKASKVIKGYIEGSNVQVVDELSLIHILGSNMLSSSQRSRLFSIIFTEIPERMSWSAR